MRRDRWDSRAGERERESKEGIDACMNESERVVDMA